MVKINVAQEYTKTPGGRFITEGAFSGEDFRKRILEPALNAIQGTEQLKVDLDGGYGYATSFLEEAFGGLVRDGFDQNKLLDSLEFKSDDEPSLINEILDYIKKAK